MEQKLKTLVANILGITIAEVVDKLGPVNNGNWDSLNHMNIITAVEKEFDVAMTMSDIQGIVDFETLKSVVERLST
jgi:acyl carrier protein